MSHTKSLLRNKLLVALILLGSSSLLLTEGRPSKNQWKDSYTEEERLCQPDHLTVYKVVLTTFWNEKSFPKHFPQWRPPAQWSKLIGRSHDKSYILFRLGKKASDGLKIFAETGRSDALDAQSQGEGGVYDEFNAPPITSGEGRTEAEFFVDGNHSRVSLISKMVPSPDWFIGIDGFDLCVNGKWLDSITIEVDVVDAGTDNGFAFTSPNWPTEPQGIIYRITNNYPSHPASSFFYPGLKKLPTMASFQFMKVKEYELSEVFHHSEDTPANEVLKMEHISYVYEEGEGDTLVLRKNASAQRATTVHVVPKHESHTVNSLHVDRTTPSYREVTTELLTTERALVTEVPRVVHHHHKDEAVVKNIVDIYSGKAKNYKVTTATPEIFDHRNSVVHTTTKKPKGKPKKDKEFHKIRPPRDCQVGEWSEWTPCSKACDIGESTRYRKVIHHARRGGQPCPPLNEKKWCGSARSCNRRYFNWSK